jgi:hypothetical protein
MAEAATRGALENVYRMIGLGGLYHRYVTRISKTMIVEHWIIDTLKKVTDRGGAIDLDQIFGREAASKAVKHFLQLDLYLDSSSVDDFGIQAFLGTIELLIANVKARAIQCNLQLCLYNLATHPHFLDIINQLATKSDPRQKFSTATPASLATRLKFLVKNKVIADLGEEIDWLAKVDSIVQLFHQQLKIEYLDFSQYFTQPFIDICRDFPSPLRLIDGTTTCSALTTDLGTFGKYGGVTRLIKLKKKMGLSRVDLHLDERYMKLIECTKDAVRASVHAGCVRSYNLLGYY